LQSPIPEEFAEILDSVPPEKKEFIERTLIAGFSLMGQNSAESAVAKKLTPEHISTFLDITKEDMQKSYKESLFNKIFIFAILCISLLFFVFLVSALQSDPELLENLIFGIIGLVGGALGGYGVGIRKHDKD